MPLSSQMQKFQNTAFQCHQIGINATLHLPMLMPVQLELNLDIKGNIRRDKML